MEDISLARSNAAFLRAAYKPENNFHRKGDGLSVSEAVASLIRQLAENGHSQASIAKTLNESGISRSNGLPWQQFHLSRWMKKDGIKSAHPWRGSYNLER